MLHLIFILVKDASFSVPENLENTWAKCCSWVWKWSFKADLNLKSLTAVVLVIIWLWKVLETIVIAPKTVLSQPCGRLVSSEHSCALCCLNRDHKKGTFLQQDFIVKLIVDVIAQIINLLSQWSAIQKDHSFLFLVTTETLVFYRTSNYFIYWGKICPSQKRHLVFHSENIAHSFYKYRN